MSRPWFRAILAGGFVAGLLDLLFAIVFAATHGVTPLRLLQTIASGWMGQAAYAGGTPAGALGLASHFVLALLWAALFCAAVRHRPIWLARPLLPSIAFGVLVFLVMRLVVLPLSAYPRPVTFKPLSTALDLGSHVFLFALPIVVAARRALRAATAVGGALPDGF